MAKRNKEPTNVKVAKQINLRRNKGEKYKWTPCLVCGDLCPQHTEGLYSELDSVHLTCRYEPEYENLAKKLKKQRAEEAKISLF